jgi:hypothetical protein
MERMFRYKKWRFFLFAGTAFDHEKNGACVQNPVE